jgi:UDP-2,4-diacetamido-2,4,6-trideoxy-beta-L-altropyranose hydrolase
MRCLALAQAWQDAGGRAIFAMAETTPSLVQRLQDESIEIRRIEAQLGSDEDASVTVGMANTTNPDWIVVDGYHFGADYQAALKDAGLKVLFVDDNGHGGRYCADVVLNQNAHADESLYPNLGAATRLLLGPRFAMLRREFKSWSGWKRDIPGIARRVLVTMGGSDPDNFTQEVIQIILNTPDLSATVVVGGSNPHVFRLQEIVASAPRDVKLVGNATNMPELIAESDLAVAGAGTTSWEMCFLGLPALLIVLADNQQNNAKELSRRGVAINLGASSGIEPSTLASHLTGLVHSRDTRKAISERGRSLIDGRGAERVVRALQSA